MTAHDDAVLFADLRDLWQAADPMPADLVDRVIAAVAAEGLTQEYALLTLVETASAEPVRSDAETLTLQFSDGQTSILLHIAAAAGGRRRIDGWVDTEAVEIVLTQGTLSRSTMPAQGRFVFDDVPAGLTSVRLTTADDPPRTLATPQFEV